MSLHKFRCNLRGLQPEARLQMHAILKAVAHLKELANEATDSQAEALRACIALVPDMLAEVDLPGKPGDFATGRKNATKWN